MCGALNPHELLMKKGKNPMRLLFSFQFVVMLCLTSTVAFSQESEKVSDDKQIKASRYVLGKENELLMPVNILGPVNKPGQYMVSSETDLVSLIAYAGGFKDEAIIKDVKIVRREGTNGTSETTMINVDLEQFYLSGKKEFTPPLMPDDTILIGKRNLVTTRQVADIIRSVAFIAQTIYIVFLISKN